MLLVLLKKSLWGKVLLLLLLLPLTSAWAIDEELTFEACQMDSTRKSHYDVSQYPRNVLLVPLLYNHPDVPRESEHWPEPYARTLANFYRGRFHANVTWLRNLRTWQDFYDQSSELIAQGRQYDRIIFIAHGGFDGPVLRHDVLIETLDVQGEKGLAQKVTEAQPGNERVVSISYQASKNKAFNDYIHQNWRDLVNMPEGDMFRLLKQKHLEVQPVDQVCYAKFCSAQKLQSLSDEEKSKRIASCEKVCRPALYEARNYERVSEDRFNLFAGSLSKLSNSDSLIFMGECNAGTDTPKQKDYWEIPPGIVASSNLAGGPHHTYIHLLSSATGRLVSGPIGKSSANDIVAKVIALENNHDQDKLCMVGPNNPVQQGANAE